ncbi:MAG: IS21 family transposase [Candidatus Vogelbacteria bacterium]|nr:IS21 family transposase [Candidatus Vogelbacteria bacterium]
MLRPEEREQIIRDLARGTPLAQISRKLGRSLGTIYKYKILHERKGVLVSSERKVSQKIVPFEEAISLHIKRGETNVARIFQHLRKDGYRGSYPLLNTYIRGTAQHGLKKSYPRSIRIETEPGEQAQVDWGSFGTLRINGRKEKLYAFVYVLSYSRAIYVEFVVRQNQRILQNCHIHAFTELGIPKTILYDNMKTVVLGRKKLSNGDKQILWNPTFQDFARFYGFKPMACPPYWPRAKGKVEAGVKYLRNNHAAKNLFKKDFFSLEQLNKEAKIWLDGEANQRKHGTTKEQPRRLWKKEKPFLTFPIGEAYNPSPLLHRHSTKDGLIQYKSVFYSVPMDYAQKKLFMRESIHHGLPTLEIYDRHQLIAHHEVSFKRGEWVVDTAHMAKRKSELVKEMKQKPTGLASLVVMSRDLDYYNRTV